MLKSLIDWIWPQCPSGLPHRVRGGLVTNCNGRQFCWHSDCMRANLADITRSSDAPAGEGRE
jgi:hypothetical protein